MKVVRFVADIGKDWCVRIARSPGGPAIAASTERTLRRVTSPHSGDFPMPPAAEAKVDATAAATSTTAAAATSTTAAAVTSTSAAAAISTSATAVTSTTAAGALVATTPEPHHALCADPSGRLAAALYERVVQRDLAAGDVEMYGRWLFDVLLGDDTFAAIRAVAAAEGADLVEIALRCDPSDRALARLHWEAMRSRTGFLAAGRGLRVAVTRLVAGAAHVPRPMASPPRALFVLGGAAGDDVLRPGAELVAVLRPLRHGGRALRGDVLTRATPSRLRAAVARLAPDVVHIVAHGVPSDGTCLLQLADDEGRSDGLHSAEQLLTMLAHGAGLPAVLLLSACDSGLALPSPVPPFALPAAQTGSLASQLVEKGVPIVVGMAGRVSDVACRLFARRFGEALLAGEPIVAATEEGRRAAFSDDELPDRSIDWALPALFLSEGVAENFGTQPALDDPLDRRVAAFNVDATPVFCGRHDVLDALHDVLARSTHPVLAITSKEGDMGRTRALKELTAAALREGHVPCLLLWEAPTAVVPTSAAALARQLGAAIARTRALFALAPRAVSLTALLLHSPLDTLRADERLPPALRDHLAFATEIDARAFALALADDLGALARDARAADATSPSPRLHARSRAVVLVDDVHKWDAAIEPFLDVWITAWGLGSEAEPVPVVLTFTLDSPAATLLRPVAESRRPGWSTVQLDRFGQGEDMLAYEQVLLHPFGKVLPGFSEKRWVFDFHIESRFLQKSVEIFREDLGGVPGVLGKRDFYRVVRGQTGNDFVIAAGDEDVLDKLRKGGA